MVPNPVVERERRKSREEFVQYMLASLIVGGRPAGWNKPMRPSERGMDLLMRLDATFLDTLWDEPPLFFWEFRLAARPEDPSAGWPDLAAVSSHRVLLFELKTEAGSIREGQVDWYLDLALHHYPDRDVDLLYLTRDAVASAPSALPSRARFRNALWTSVTGLIPHVWAQADDPQGCVAHLFAGYLRETLSPTGAEEGREATRYEGPLVEAGRDPLAATAPDAAPSVGGAQLVAAAVQDDGRQRAYPHAWGSLEDAKRFRRQVADALAQADPPAAKPVSAWVWQRDSSGGRALTEAGEECGIEVRFSRPR